MTKVKATVTIKCMPYKTLLSLLVHLIEKGYFSPFIVCHMQGYCHNFLAMIAQAVLHPMGGGWGCS